MPQQLEHWPQPPNQVSNLPSPYHFSTAISINFHQEKEDTHSVKGIAPNTDRRGGVEEPEEGVAEDVHEHGEAVDGFDAAQDRVAVALKVYKQKISPLCPWETWGGAELSDGFMRIYEKFMRLQWEMWSDSFIEERQHKDLEWW